MASKIEEGLQVAARLQVETEEGFQYLPGVVNISQGIPSGQILGEIKEKQDPYLDYFVFSDVAPDPAHPEASRVLVFMTEANHFDLNGREAKFKLLAPNEIGADIEVPDIRYDGGVDNRWKDKIKKVEVAVAKSAGQKNTAFDDRLAAAFSERLSDRISGSVLGIGEINAAVKEVLEEMREVCWGVRETLAELIDDPDGKKGDKAVRVSVKIFPPARGIIFEGVPEHIQRQILEKLGSDMDAVFRTHPAVVSKNLSSDVLISPRLEFHSDSNTFTWLYPPDVPTLPGDPIFDGLSGLVAGKAVDRVPAPASGEPMPIPSDVFGNFTAHLKELLDKEPGVYGIEVGTTEDGLARISVKHEPARQFAILEQTVEAIKDEIGLDLAEDAKLLGKGTRGWSRQRFRNFIDGLKKKFLSVGRELLTENDNFMYEQWNGVVAILPINIPLIKPSQIKFEGDVDIAGIGGAGKLSAALGTKPMTREEFGERLKEIEEMYHRAGYLIAGETPVRRDGTQLEVVPDGNDSLRVIVKVVRMGSVRVNGDIREEGKRAFAEAMHMKEGEPLLIGELLHRMKRAAVRLHLRIEKEPVFVIRPDRKMDITFNVTRAQSSAQAGIAFGGDTIALVASGQINHFVPGTSQTTFNATLGRYILDSAPFKDRLTGGVSLYSEFLPINASGQHFGAGASYYRAPYAYRRTVDGYEEIGVSQRYFGSITYFIPIGDAGIASPVQLSVGARESAVHREGERADGSAVSGTNYYSGGTVGVDTVFDDQLFTGDLVRTRTSVGLDHGHTGNHGDITLSGEINYSVPLGRYFAVEAVISAAKRVAVYGGELQLERLFGAGDIPLLDFGRSLGELYVGSYRWYSGLLLVLKNNEIIQPFIGVTVSGDPSGSARSGAGVGVRLILGISFYLGYNNRRRATAGLGASYRAEM